MSDSNIENPAGKIIFLWDSDVWFIIIKLSNQLTKTTKRSPKSIFSLKNRTVT